MSLRLNTPRMHAEQKDGIGWMTFNHPERHNALSLEMWQAMGDILEHFAQDDEVRVIIMRGAGNKAFVSGADISEFDEKRANAAQRAHYGKIAGRATDWLNKIEKPLLALVQGFCIGGGLATALAADVRFATPESRFSIPAAKLGLGYEFEGLAKLARIVGPSRARDIMFSARLLPSDEALSMGLINFIYPESDIEQACIAYARSIAENAPLTLRAAKASLNAWEHNSDPAEQARVRELIDDCFDSEDYREGRAAFAARRKPDFVGR